VRTGAIRRCWSSSFGDLARHYAERMVALLAPFSNAGTARYQVVDGVQRDEFLHHPEVAPAGAGSDWWQLAEPITRRPAPRPA
jgi:hypothetical protein